MEFSLRNAAGTEMSFNGSRAELDVVLETIRVEGAALLSAIQGGGVVVADAQHSGIEGLASKVQDLQTMLDSIEAQTDVERVAAMAHFSVVTSGSGLTDEKASQWYSELGLPKPGRWASTFGNTKARGYIHNSSDGWRPTTAGENLATHGIRRPATSRRRRSGGTAEG